MNHGRHNLYSRQDGIPCRKTRGQLCSAALATIRLELRLVYPHSHLFTTTLA